MNLLFSVDHWELSSNPVRIKFCILCPLLKSIESDDITIEWFDKILVAKKKKQMRMSTNSYARDAVVGFDASNRTHEPKTSSRSK